jgi:FtsP/CotA-like multicopper oxidase with cupredoxin domain
MDFPNNMSNTERKKLALLGFIVLAAVTAVAAVFAVVVVKGGDGTASAETVREYNIEIVSKDIDYGGGNIWHAWVYRNADDPNDTGSVPGPTLEVNVGEKLVVNVTNTLDFVHSFHSHMENYSLESDGSQINTITGIGAGAMIPPGGSWTYEFSPTRPGTFYYHCHSADGGLHITDHIHQGLYGAIIVHDPDEAPHENELVLFMGEMGRETEGDAVPPYIMNGLGIPGGEATLETIFKEQGIEAVAAQFNKTLPVFEAKTEEEVILHLINIGDQIHTFHLHGVKLISREQLNGEPWPANVVPLTPGEVDSISITFTQQALWLFHCHVVAHADAGMIGLFNVAGPPEPTPAGQ